MFDPTELAVALGEMIAGRAQWFGKGCCWVGQDERNGWISWRGPTLYQGAIGTGLACAHLWRVTGEDRLRATAIGSCHFALARIPRLIRHSLGGIHEGWPGTVWTALEICKLVEDDQLRGKVVEMATGVCRDGLLRPQGRLDFVGGGAGAGPLFFRLHQCLEVEEYLDAAHALLDDLLNEAEHVSTGGMAWPSDMQTKWPLIGFAHGAAGIGLGTGSLACWSGRGTEATTVVHEAIKFQDLAYNPSLKAWPEPYRHPAASDIDPAQHSWCHGGMGIGYARFLLGQELSDQALIEQGLGIMEREMQQRGGEAVAGGVGLCHGISGLLVMCRRARKAAPLGALAESHENILEEVLLTLSPAKVVDLVGDDMSLMTGAAGLLYSLATELHGEGTMCPFSLWASV